MDARALVRWIQVLGASATLLVTGCGPASPEVAAPAATAGPAANGPASASPTGSAGPAGSATAAARSTGGLDAPDNDPTLVATARAALACLRKPECEARDRWYEPFQSGKPIDPKTLVNLLDDERPEIRSMAAEVLRPSKGQPGYQTDAGLATRVLDALEREKDEQVARKIAIPAGWIDAKATGLEARLSKLLRSEPREAVRAELVGVVLNGNRENPAIVAVVKEILAKDASERVQLEALQAFGVREMLPQACPLWAASLGHPKESIADRAISLSLYHGCKNDEAILDAVEKRPPLSPENLEAICIQGGASDAVKKKRLVAVTDKWAMDTAIQGYRRAQALKVLARCDLARGKKVAAALLEDGEESVRNKAAQIEKATVAP